MPDLVRGAAEQRTDLAHGIAEGARRVNRLADKSGGQGQDGGFHRQHFVGHVGQRRGDVLDSGVEVAEVAFKILDGDRDVIFGSEDNLDGFA